MACFQIRRNFVQKKFHQILLHHHRTHRNLLGLQGLNLDHPHHLRLQQKLWHLGNFQILSLLLVNQKPRADLQVPKPRPNHQHLQ